MISLVLNRVLVPLNLLEKKYMNQCINNVLDAPVFIKQKCFISYKNGFKNRKQSSRQRTISGTKLCRMNTVGLAQCCFTDLAILKAKILNNF